MLSCIVLSLVVLFVPTKITTIILARQMTELFQGNLKWITLCDFNRKQRNDSFPSAGSYVKHSVGVLAQKPIIG